MQIIPITDSNAIPAAVAAINDGGLIVIPTDTVYGVCCSPFNPEAIDHLYELKQRPREKAIQVLLADLADVEKVAQRMTPLAERLAARFWPGALTLTLPKRDDLPANISVYESVGVRVPDHNLCRAVIRAAGGALAATSANHSGGSNPTNIQAALEAFGDSVALYLDGGSTAGDVASTVIESHGDRIRILRQGPITEKMIQAVLSEG